MKQITFLLAIGFSALALSCSRNNNLSSLKKTITEKSVYDGMKENKISELKIMRTSLGGANPSLEYTVNSRIAEEYSTYQLDSALRYHERNLHIATLLKDKNKKIESAFLLANLYSKYGLFLEGKFLLDSIRPEITEDLLPLYYTSYMELYDIYFSFSQREEHRRIAETYRDTIRIITGNEVTLETECNYQELHKKLAESESMAPEYSYATYFLGLYHEKNGQADSAKYYYTLSSISDLRNSNKNQGSMIKLARLCYQDEEYTEAYKFFRSTMEDAINGNMKIRTMRISEPFALINDTYQAQETHNKTTISISLVSICILFILVLLLLYYVYRQIKKGEKAKQEIQDANAITNELNAKLVEQKKILEKVNFVQEKYIAHFFELSSIHLSKMESYQHSLRKLMTSGKMDDLNRELKSNEMLENELQEQYIMFDKIFLDLYPTFVEDFNALFEPENRIILKPGELMNTEIRIYALMRVGFIDSTKIASFLRCSMSTIYTYRTKSRNRSNLSREKFEAAVMKIGMPPLKSNS